MKKLVNLFNDFFFFLQALVVLMTVAVASAEPHFSFQKSIQFNPLGLLKSLTGQSGGNSESYGSYGGSYGGSYSQPTQVQVEYVKAAPRYSAPVKVVQEFVRNWYLKIKTKIYTN